MFHLFIYNINVIGLKTFNLLQKICTNESKDILKHFHFDI